MFEEKLIENLVASLDDEEAALHSYHHFHAEGLTYINLLRTERITVKLYMFHRAQHNFHGYLVWPHNHSYNFYHQTLFGTVTNHTFKLAEGDDWSMFTYSTPLNGGAGLARAMPVGLKLIDEKHRKPGEGYYLEHDEIHTISVSQRAAAVLVQYHDIKPGAPTMLFAPAAANVDCGGARYEKMAPSILRAQLKKFRTWMREIDG